MFAKKAVPAKKKGVPQRIPQQMPQQMAQQPPTMKRGGKIKKK